MISALRTRRLDSRRLNWCRGWRNRSLLGTRRRASGLGTGRGGSRGSATTRTGSRRTLAAGTLGAGRRRHQLALATDDVALVDPHLHADPAEGGLGLVQAVVDVGTQRVQRHPAFAVELRAAHFGATKTSGALHPDALHVRLAHRRLNE